MHILRLGISCSDGDVLCVFAGALTGVESEQAYRLRDKARENQGKNFDDSELRGIFAETAKDLDNPYAVSDGEHGLLCIGFYGDVKVEVFRNQDNGLTLKLSGELAEIAAMVRGTLDVDKPCWKIDSEAELLSTNQVYERGQSEKTD